ncbi:MAG: rRNA maturation RNase YbeY [Patescibacteria group bacterium]|nr:rRNA maturation RNase YbeY [Patescibacteria group bacterium]
MTEIDLIEEVAVGIPKKILLGAIRAVLDKKGGKKKVFLSVVFITPVKMRKLNKKWRKIDKSTDVLSFPVDEAVPEKAGVRVLGDIFICPSYVADAAREIGVDFDEQLLRVLVHGVLHLLGFDHERRDDKGKMLRLQERLLKQHLAS